MHLVCYYPYYSCLCTFWSYHPYLLLQFFSCSLYLHWLLYTCMYKYKYHDFYVTKLRLKIDWPALLGSLLSLVSPLVDM